MTETQMAVEIGKLAGLDLFTLRERWRTLCGSEPPQRIQTLCPEIASILLWTFVAKEALVGPQNQSD